MISFDLKCAGAHVFEAWFRSSADYDRQRAAGQIPCPVCGDVDVAKAVMAPAVAAKGNQRTAAAGRPDDVALSVPAEPPSDARIKALMSALAKAQAQALETSQWVGASFADKARAMHYGEADQAAIHGTASPDEARAMIEEGVPVAPLLVPVVPPDRAN